MSVALLAPLGLAALAALAIPIAIHLVRRIELQTTEFAALRWIAERVRPRRRLRFERPWLLLLRLSLLALLAMLLARPVMLLPPLAQTARVYVAPGADIARARAAVATGADWRWLAPGFPAIETPAPTAVPLSSLLREADAMLPAGATLTVVVPEALSGLDGERPQLAHAVDWHIVPGSMPADEANVRDERDIAVRFAPAAEPGVRYLEAAVAALARTGTRRYALDIAPQDAPIGEAAQTLVWLGAEPTPAVTKWIESGGTAIVDRQPRAAGTPTWRDASGSVLARAAPLGRGQLVALAPAFAPRELPALLDADFPERLRNLVEGAPPIPTRAPAAAIEPRTGAQAIGLAAAPAASKPLDPWLALAIALLVLAERIVATRARQPA